jgi:hypothetical protein
VKCLSGAFHMPFSLPFKVPFSLLLALQRAENWYFSPVFTGFGAVYPANERLAGFVGPGAP